MNYKKLNYSAASIDEKLRRDSGQDQDIEKMKGELSSLALKTDELESKIFEKIDYNISITKSERYLGSFSVHGAYCHSQVLKAGTYSIKPVAGYQYMIYTYGEDVDTPTGSWGSNVLPEKTYDTDIIINIRLDGRTVLTDDDYAAISSFEIKRINTDSIASILAGHDQEINRLAQKINKLIEEGVDPRDIKPAID